MSNPFGASADNGTFDQVIINPTSDVPELLLQGPALDADTGGNHGLVLDYLESYNTETPPVIIGTGTIRILRPTIGQYQWQFTNGDGSSRLAMQVGNDHSLALYNPSGGSSSIVLTPDPTNAQITINTSPVLTVRSISTGAVMLPAVYAKQLFIPATGGSDTGVVYQGPDGAYTHFIHSYGTDNLFVGANAGNFTMATDSTTGSIPSNNTGLGANALLHLQSGNTNMAIGSNALFNDTIGSANLAIGDSAMGGPNEILGGYNVAIGRGAGYNWHTSSSNVAIGYNAFNQHDGGWGDNIAIGNSSMFAAQGNLLENIAIGASTLQKMNGGQRNTAIGASAGYAVTSGSANTLIGDQVAIDFAYPIDDPANTSLTTGSYNTFIGAFAGLLTPAQHSNATAIGYMAKVDADDAVVFGHVNTGEGDTTATPKVGIGTTTPQTRLDVVGDATVRGVLRVPAAGDVGMGAFTSGTDPTPAQN